MDMVPPDASKQRPNRKAEAHPNLSWNRILFELPGTSRRIRQHGPNLMAILVLMAVYASDWHRMLRGAGIADTKCG